MRPSNLLIHEPEFGPNPTEHPARFPVQIPDFFVKLLTKPGQVVLDPFAGTGTTGVAAENLDRRWLAIEMEEKYARALPERLVKGR